ncbi:hypothetical protein [Knoellia subterranea]|uniref:Uncharacterized protein n=1 Tax=Knoellia subterranea KCTC 19937 TaxID=1385521 RepID=A0A0A0JJZ4_9MICO|nr:hypothetical protein [Knoellia subterranea]KGN36377.1 hypothetical protein N803_05395 [Knoellia subterranea KCTC 19937]
MDDLRSTTPWSPEDDALLRGALLSLRDDVMATPIPEPAFVRARGDRGRRRRMLAVTAGVAAAVAIVAAVGFRGLAREDAAPPPLPATPTPTVATTTPSTTPTTTPTQAPTGTPTASATVRPTNTGTATPSSTPRPTSSTGGSTGGPSPSAPAGNGAPPQILSKGNPAIPATAFLSAQDWQDATPFAMTIGSWVPEEATVGAVVPCDPNAEATPASIAWMRDTGESNWTGAERIQKSNLQSDGSSNASEPAAIVRAMLNDTTCKESSDPAVTLKQGPRTGTILVTATYPDGNGPHSYLVGAVALRDGLRTATFVLADTRVNDDAWAFLGNLMDAAAKK